jgi:hypothetical protein
MSGASARKGEVQGFNWVGRDRRPRQKKVFMRAPGKRPISVTQYDLLIRCHGAGSKTSNRSILPIALRLGTEPGIHEIRQPYLHLQVSLVKVPYLSALCLSASR